MVEKLENKSKAHWEQVYQHNDTNLVSWAQPVPYTSLNMVAESRLSRQAAIIDIGGGDSRFVDYLIEQQYTNITVLDISGKALENAKRRLGEKADLVTWIESDITNFEPREQYDFWHDRAAFHFLTSGRQVQQYADIASEAIGGILAIGTFSEQGPQFCSGLPVQRYSEKDLYHPFMRSFRRIGCTIEDHVTPAGNTQNFLFCRFGRIRQ